MVRWQATARHRTPNPLGLRGSSFGAHAKVVGKKFYAFAGGVCIYDVCTQRSSIPAATSALNASRLNVLEPSAATIFTTPSCSSPVLVLNTGYRYRTVTVLAVVSRSKRSMDPGRVANDDSSTRGTSHSMFSVAARLHSCESCPTKNCNTHHTSRQWALASTPQHAELLCQDRTWLPGFPSRALSTYWVMDAPYCFCNAGTTLLMCVTVACTVNIS